MIYRSETRLLLPDVGLKFERVDVQMIRWMCGVFMKDRKTNEINYEHRVNKYMEIRVESGRPRKILLESVEADMAEL